MSEPLPYELAVKCQDLSEASKSVIDWLDRTFPPDIGDDVLFAIMGSVMTRLIWRMGGSEFGRHAMGMRFAQNLITSLLDDD